MSSTTTTDKFAAVLAERMEGKYEGPAAQREKSAQFLAYDLLEAGHDCDRDRIRERVAELVGGLYARRRDYIHMVHRYGVTTREIGEALGLSHQRVAQILKEPYDSLSEPIGDTELAKLLSR